MDIDNIITHLEGLAQRAASWIENNISSFGIASQAGLIVAAGAIAVIVHKALHPRVDRYIANLEIVAQIRRILHAGAGLIGILVFLVINALSLALVQEHDFGIGTSLLNTTLNLAGAWAIIQLSAGMIANKSLARAVSWTAWSVAVINIVGLLQPLIGLFDSVGFSLGATRITLWSVVNALILFALLLWAVLFASALLSHRLQSSKNMAPRTQVLVGKLSKFILIVLVGLVTLSSMGVNLATLAVFTGALGVGVGIGLQHQVSNILSGLFLLLDKSIKPGDVIEVGETYGWVKEMSARYVGLITRDNKEILIPNDTFVLNQVINWSHSDRTVRLEVRFGVAYDSDPHHIRELAAAAARQASRVSDQPAPLCHLVGFGESSIDFSLRFWIGDPEKGVTNVKGEVLLALWDTFKAHGIEIPYPHRYVIMAGKPAAGTPPAPEQQ